MFIHKLAKASDTLGNFIRRSRRSAKIASCAWCSNCDFRRTPRSAYKIADIWHVRYRRLNSPAFTKCARCRDFLWSLLRIASKANPSGLAILSHEIFKTATSPRSAEKLPGVSRSIGGENRLRSDRWRSDSPRLGYKIARCVAGLSNELKQNLYT